MQLILFWLTELMFMFFFSVAFSLARFRDSQDGSDTLLYCRV